MNSTKKTCNDGQCDSSTIHLGYPKDIDDSTVITNANVIPKKTSFNSTAEIPFWSNDPNIIFSQVYIFEFFPTNKMTYEQKLNAISRLIIVLTIVSFIFTQSIRLLAISAFTLLSIYLLYKYHNEQKQKRNKKKENFDPIVGDVFKDNGLTPPPSNDVFDTPDSSNPFSNVLMTDYDFNTDKKPAPPSYNDDINNSIIDNTKQMVANLNASQPDITDKLFKDLGDELYFEQSMRQFYSNPNTTIPNDQTSFADFCYGGMLSCKEGNMFACAKNLSRFTN